MSCTPDDPRFRLLDRLVGWEHEHAERLGGLADPDGIRLAPIAGRPDDPDPRDVTPYLLPSWLARGCDPCEWFLAPADPSCGLMRLAGCGECFTPVWGDCDPGVVSGPTAVAAGGGLLAVADGAGGRVWVWTGDGGQLVGSMSVAGPRVLAVAPGPRVLVAREGLTEILRFGAGGDALEPLRTGLDGEIERLGVERDGAVWALVRRGDGGITLARGGVFSARFRPGTPGMLARRMPRTGLLAAGEDGFCLSAGPAASGRSRCFERRGGCPTDGLAPGGRELHRRGQLLTAALDGGIPRCRWHRVRIDADVPEGTSVALAVATGEEPKPVAQGSRAHDPEWADFEPGRPHPDDWHEAPGGALDSLVRQPPGRYLFVRLRLVGDGRATPRVRRVRVDLPRATSAEHLPAVYREQPGADDFTERFISLFDAEIGDLDRAIERLPALLDGQGVPDDVLPFIGALVGQGFDPSWPPEVRRGLIRRGPELSRRRGTPDGLAMAVETVFGARPVIEEPGLQRPWGRVAVDAGLGRSRLFGRRSARARVGVSRVGGAALRPYGDPDADHLTAAAHRVRVLAPPAPMARGVEGRRRLQELVDAHAPAHTVVRLRVGGSGLVVGERSSVGVDTALVPGPPAVLGGDPLGEGVRLGRASVLGAGLRPPRRAAVAGGVRVGATDVRRWRR